MWNGNEEVNLICRFLVDRNIDLLIGKLGKPARIYRIDIYVTFYWPDLQASTKLNVFIINKLIHSSRYLLRSTGHLNRKRPVSVGAGQIIRLELAGVDHWIMCGPVFILLSDVHRVLVKYTARHEGGCKVLRTVHD